MKDCERNLRGNGKTLATTTYGFDQLKQCLMCETLCRTWKSKIGKAKRRPGMVSGK